MHKLQIFTSATGHTLQPALGQACDQCRRRKTRCNRAQPCVHCQKTAQTCSYDEAPRTRGRKPRRKPLVDPRDEQNSATSGGIVVSEWADALPAPPASGMLPQGTMEEQRLPMAPASTLEWQNPPCIVSMPLVSSTRIKPLNSSNDICFNTPGEEIPQQIFTRKHLLPYVHLFFERLYAVYPVIDKETLLGILEAPQLESQPLPPSLYILLTALAAAAVVQLNIGEDDVCSPSGASPKLSSRSCPLPGTPLAPELLVEQCLEMRKSAGFIEDAGEWTILTSFFLFAYYGNLDQPRSAWYYLREAIGFAQSLGLDDPHVYLMLDPKTSQRRRLLFWLLFVTERAYALQHRNRVTLQKSIGLPHVFESPDPKLMYGFVALVRVFSAVENAFITAWRNQNMPMLVQVPSDARQALGKLLKDDTELDALQAKEMNETQRLDIMVTQQWLKALAWQLQCSMDASSQTSSLESGALGQVSTRDSPCVIEASKNLLETVHGASGPSLEAHGIGMEQKVSDVAHCLCDVLERSDEPEVVLEFFSTQDFLHQFMVFLATFRRHESQYLQPLMQRASRTLSSFVEPQRPLLLVGGEDDHWLAEESLVEQQSVVEGVYHSTRPE